MAAEPVPGIDDAGDLEGIDRRGHRWWPAVQGRDHAGDNPREAAAVGVVALQEPLFDALPAAWFRGPEAGQRAETEPGPVPQQEASVEPPAVGRPGDLDHQGGAALELAEEGDVVLDVLSQPLRRRSPIPWRRAAVTERTVGLPISHSIRSIS